MLQIIPSSEFFPSQVLLSYNIIYIISYSKEVIHLAKLVMYLTKVSRTYILVIIQKLKFSGIGESLICLSHQVSAEGTRINNHQNLELQFLCLQLAEVYTRLRPNIFVTQLDPLGLGYKTVGSKGP